MLDGWRLVSVAGDKVTFERGGLHHDLVIGAPAESGAAPAEGATPPNGQPFQPSPVEK
jgi:hypothetical protein